MIRSFDGKTPKIADSAWISEAAYVVGDVEIGENASVWPGTVIRGDLASIKIGKYTDIQDGCVIHAGSPYTSPGDCIIGEHVNVGHGAVINCHKIGNNVLIGMNATVLHDVEIGDFSVIAGGCVVMRGTKIPSRSFVAGVPGQILGQTAPQHKVWVEGSSTYPNLAQKYKEEGL